MSSAFERVAQHRGSTMPEVRRASLHVVPDVPVEVAERPSAPTVRFAGIVGQGRLIMRLETHLRSAVARGAQPGHILLDGGPGLGKTTLAQAVAGELAALNVESVFHELTGDTISNPRKLATELGELRDGDVFFIDEVQALKPSVQTALLRVLSDGVMFVEATAKQPSIRFEVPAFTLVAATTHPAKLSDAFRSRFKFAAHLEPYTFDDLQLVTMLHAETASVKLSDQAAECIARSSRYTPRLAIRWLEAVRDYAYEVTGNLDAPVDLETAQQGLEYHDVDQFGLEERDRRYLRCMAVDYCDRPVGVHVIAATLGLDVTELQDDVEPYLLTSGLLRRERGGRQATKATYVALSTSTCATAEDQALTPPVWLRDERSGQR